MKLGGGTRRGERGAHVAFWGAISFFSNLNILVKVQKGLVRGKTRGSFSLFAPHMSEGFFFLYSTIWLSERFPSVIKSYAIKKPEPADKTKGREGKTEMEAA